MVSQTSHLFLRLSTLRRVIARLTEQELFTVVVFDPPRRIETLTFDTRETKGKTWGGKLHGIERTVHRVPVATVAPGERFQVTKRRMRSNLSQSDSSPRRRRQRRHADKSGPKSALLTDDRRCDRKTHLVIRAVSHDRSWFACDPETPGNVFLVINHNSALRACMNQDCDAVRRVQKYTESAPSHVTRDRDCRVCAALLFRRSSQSRSVLLR